MNRTDVRHQYYSDRHSIFGLARTSIAEVAQLPRERWIHVPRNTGSLLKGWGNSEEGEVLAEESGGTAGARKDLVSWPESGRACVDVIGESLFKLI